MHRYISPAVRRRVQDLRSLRGLGLTLAPGKPVDLPTLRRAAALEVFSKISQNVHGSYDHLALTQSVTPFPVRPSPLPDLRRMLKPYLKTLVRETGGAYPDDVDMLIGDLDQMFLGRGVATYRDRYEAELDKLSDKTYVALEDGHPVTRDSPEAGFYLTGRGTESGSAQLAPRTAAARSADVAAARTAPWRWNKDPMGDSLVALPDSEDFATRLVSTRVTGYDPSRMGESIEAQLGAAGGGTNMMTIFVKAGSAGTATGEARIKQEILAKRFIWQQKYGIDIPTSPADYAFRQATGKTVTQLARELTKQLDPGSLTSPTLRALAVDQAKRQCAAINAGYDEASSTCVAFTAVPQVEAAAKGAGIGKLLLIGGAAVGGLVLLALLLRD